jgi:hypothetical protein
MTVPGTSDSLGDDVQRQLAENETRFRAANERIEGAAVRLEGSEDRFPFVCECGRADCLQLVHLTIAEYERARANPRWFLHAPGHAITNGGISEVVEVHDGYEIAEKQGAAAEVAEADAAHPRKREHE